MLGWIQLQGEELDRNPQGAGPELPLCHSALCRCFVFSLLFTELLAVPSVSLVLDRLLTKTASRISKEDVGTDEASSGCSGIEGGWLKEEKPLWDWGIDFLAHIWLLKRVLLSSGSVSHNRKFAKSTKSPGFGQAGLILQDFPAGMALFSCPGSRERGKTKSLLPTAVSLINTMEGAGAESLQPELDKKLGNLVHLFPKPKRK